MFLSECDPFPARSSRCDTSGSFGVSARRSLAATDPNTESTNLPSLVSRGVITMAAL
jgi:hypothetical protein